MRVLVVEDEEFLAEMIAEGLRAAAIAVDVAHDGRAGQQQLQLGEYDVAVLDRDLPGMRGDDICRWIIEERLLTRVLMLTAAVSIQDRVGGLALGADDYLTKPFAHQELLARVLALGRRVHPAQPPLLKRGDIVVDTVARAATRAGRLLQLSPKEFAVLEALARADGGVVSNEDLIEQVWESSTSYDTNAARITMSKLRKKLGDPTVVETVPAVGYRLAASGSDS